MYSIAGPNSIIVKRVKGPSPSTVPGGVSGSVRPGVAAGAGTGSGGGAAVGPGGSDGVSGGTSAGVSGGVVGGVIGGVPGGVVGSVPGAYGQATNWPAEAVRVGGGIKPPTKVRDVKPAYPETARTARVQGVVICEALIGADGKVADVRVLRSTPLLDQAAVEAVRQWEFTPSLLNGNPVPIIMTMTVNFTLDGGTPNLGIR